MPVFAGLLVGWCVGAEFHSLLVGDFVFYPGYTQGFRVLGGERERSERDET